MDNEEKNYKKVMATRCRFNGNETEKLGLANTINKIGYENILQILPCYNGSEEYFYTIIYEGSEKE